MTRPILNGRRWSMMGLVVLIHAVVFAAIYAAFSFMGMHNG